MVIFETKREGPRPLINLGIKVWVVLVTAAMFLTLQQRACTSFRGEKRFDKMAGDFFQEKKGIALVVCTHWNGLFPLRTEQGIHSPQTTNWIIMILVPPGYQNSYLSPALWLFFYLRSCDGKGISIRFIYSEAIVKSSILLKLYHLINQFRYFKNLHERDWSTGT